MENNKTKNKFEFNNGLCFLLETLARIIGKKLGAKIIKTKEFKNALKKGPMVLISNHTSAYDFIYISSAFAYHKLNFMVAENMKYTSPTFAKLITKYNAISKRQYYSDIKSIKGVKSCIDSGISVLICPEGKVASNGVTGVIPESISRLLQWLNCQVGVIKVEGGGLVLPKWADNRRKGKVIVNCDLLFTKDDLKNLSKKEIYEKLTNAIYHNNHKWQQENSVKLKGENLAVGLDRLLYKCPKCQSEFKMQSSGNTIRCMKCGLEAEYLPSGSLKYSSLFKGPERIDLWFDDEIESIQKEFENDEFTLTANVDLTMENDTLDGYKKISEGIITMDRENLSYKSNAEGEFSDIKFSIKEMDTMCYLPGKAIEIYDDKHVYKFMFKGEQSATKFALYVEENYKLNHKKQNN